MPTPFHREFLFLSTAKPGIPFCQAVKTNPQQFFMPVPPSQLKVIFEDNHLLVVDKPPLLPTMGVGKGEDSLFHRAQDYIKQKYNKPGKVYIGVVSRIDSFVSGVVVLARTSKAASRLSEQFRSGTVKKTYWAIVPGELSHPEGFLEDRLVKNESQHRMVALGKNAPVVAGEKTARLCYRTIGKRGSLQLLEVELETGRKHQIRVQLENAGCPIVGDRKYGSQLPFAMGIALHSRQLVIEHPTRKVVQSFESDPPAWWNIGLYRLK
jgi:23S rRNA pseudouridine1911/1915/1917 synthase